MSGFSPEWLALREPADRAARNNQVLAACQRAFEDRESVRVCDIGAGTGASVRALAELLPPRQVWTLVDSDEANLAAAFDQLSRWGNDARAVDGGLALRRGNRDLVVYSLIRDLAAAPACWPEDTDLVTASALFDLVSTSWLGEFVACLSARKITLLSMLTFDGQITADPVLEFDAAIADAFRAHQRRDKGFGPAAGPRAADGLEAALTTAEYLMVAGESPWSIDSAASALLHATLEGIAAAAREMKTIPEESIDGWLRARMNDTHRLTIGHRDVFAQPC
jgi:hypothetical protein